MSYKTRKISRGKYARFGPRDSKGRLKKRTTKKGNARKGAPKGARLAYDALPKKRKSSSKKGRGRPSKLPKTKMLTLKGKKKSFSRKSTHANKSAAKKATGKGYFTRVVKGGNRYGVYRRKK